jgi:hypothetical protein
MAMGLRKSKRNNADRCQPVIEKKKSKRPFQCIILSSPTSLMLLLLSLDEIDYLAGRLQQLLFLFPAEVARK